tara:strand:+ start:9747 stop:10517 length:771 start_codon:yes stop_codon:yes gene_type:complete
MKDTEIRGVLLDLAGTLYSGSERISGARHCLKELNKRGIPYCFLTNTTTQSLASIRAKLDSFGIEVGEEQILTPLAAAREQFAKDGFSTANLMIREEAKVDLAGIEESETPDVVIMGDLGEGFTYEVMNRAFRQLANGAAFYALARNRSFEADGELFLDMGAYVEALHYASLREPLCLGKPSEAFFASAVDLIGVPRENVLVVGDDLESDVLGAMEQGMTGVLVRTGKFDEGALQKSDRQPSFVIDSIRDLPALLP